MKKARYDEVITKGKWNGKVIFDNDPLEKAWQWNKPRRIFHNICGDTFHEKADYYWFFKLLHFAHRTPQHTHIFLTKRSSRALEFFQRAKDSYKNIQVEFPLPNVWVGITAEDQEQADKRIPILAQIPAAVRFVSFEPLLEKIEIGRYLHACTSYDNDGLKDVEFEPDFDWAIVGCESGRNARPMNMQWVEYLECECSCAGVPFFFKQAMIGGALVESPELYGKVYNEYPEV